MEIAKLSVAKVVPAQIEGANIDEYIEQVLPVIQAKKDVVVTADNFGEIQKLRTDLRKDMSKFDDDVKLVRNESIKLVAPWLEKAKIVQKAYKEADASLKNGVDFYKNQIKEEKRNKIQNEINRLIACELGAEELNIRFAKLFEFNEKWLNKTATQTEIDLGIAQEIERLKQLYSSYLEQTKFIRAYVKKAVEDNGFGEGMIDDNTYIQLFDNGTDSTQIMAMVDNQVANIKRQFEAKEREIEAKKQAKIERMKQARPEPEPVYVQPTKTEPVQLKTTTENQIVLDITEPIEKANKLTVEQRNAKYDYLYQFSGNAQEMLILKAFMEHLRDSNNSTFKFERK